MNTLNILLVEDDVAVCNRFLEYSNTFEEIKIVKTTNNSYQALLDVVTYIPSVVILDLELHEGGGNGLEFLAQLKDTALKHRPYIIITTNNSSRITFQLARELGADFIMSKHQKNYSEKTVIDLLYRMKDSLLKYVNTENTTEPSPHITEKNVIARIHSELDSIGVSQKAIGYKYLSDAILMVINDQRLSIYDNISMKYNKSSGSIEHAMQDLINRTWRTTDIETLVRYYTAPINSTKGSPTITEFIHYYARKISDEML